MKYSGNVYVQEDNVDEVVKMMEDFIKEKLRKQEKVHKPQVLDSQTVKREELNLENKVYSDKVEEDDDRMTGLRHKIAGDVVMLSHLAMKLYYVKVLSQLKGSVPT